MKRLFLILVLLSIWALSQPIGLEKLAEGKMPPTNLPTAALSNASRNGATQVVNSFAFIYQARTKPVIDVRDYGAIGDGQVATDCYMTSRSPILTCESSHFAASDLGKRIAVYGSGPTVKGNIQPLASSISSFLSATQVALANMACNSTTHVIAAITTCSRAQNVATCNTSANHTFQASQMVALNSVGNDTSFTGVWPINTVPSGTSFTIKSTLLNDVTSVSGGTADGHSERVVWGTDNTAAVQAATDACGTLGGCKIIIPKGLYLTRGVNLPCSQIGNFVAGGYYNCTIAYNNITFAGDSADVASFENWDPATSMSGKADSSLGTAHPGLIQIGISATGDFDAPGANVPSNPVKNIEIYGLTLRQVKNATNGIKPIFDFASDDVKIHHAKVVGPSYECVYQGGKSRRWDVHDNYLMQCGLGGPANSTSTSALNESGSESAFHDNRVQDSGQCLEGGGHDNRFYGNLCDMRGPDVAGASPVEWANLTSATYGLWRWALTNNRIIGGRGATVENVLGMFRDVTIGGNTLVDDLGGVTIGSGKETNNVSYGPQPAAPHGLTVVSNNTWTYTGAQFPPGTLFAVNGNQKPYLEDVIFDHNRVTYMTGFCNASPQKSCTRAADCPVGSCTVPNGIFAAAAPGFSGPKWLPSTTYAKGDVVVPTVDNTYIYMNKGSMGISGTSEPTFCITKGCTFVDNTVTWTLYGSRPQATISNLTVSAPPGIAPFGTEIRLDPGSSRQALTITNFRYNNAARIVTRESLGRSDAGFVVETIPAGMAYSDNNRYSDSLPASGKWMQGQTVNRITPSTGAGAQGWLVTRTGYTGPVWSAGAPCTFGDFITASPDNNHVFRAVNVKPGVTGRAQPEWSTSAGMTTIDNTCTWQESGASALFLPQPEGFVQPTKEVQ